MCILATTVRLSCSHTVIVLPVNRDLNMKLPIELSKHGPLAASIEPVPYIRVFDSVQLVLAYSLFSLFGNI
jgi:hypothetical protein